MEFTQEEFKIIQRRFSNAEQYSPQWIKVSFEWVDMHIEKRNGYCDRGRYGFLPEVHSEYMFDYEIDGADGFPRYMFSLEAAMDELTAWVAWRTIRKQQQQKAKDINTDEK